MFRLVGLAAVRVALTAAVLSLVACAAGEPAPKSTDDESAALTECRGLSPLGTAVRDAAQGAQSTTSLVTTQHNAIVGGPIVGGEAYANAMVKLVQSAKREVIFEVFILEDGWLAGRLRDAIASLDPAIPVYVLVSSDRSRDETFNRGGGNEGPSFEASTALRVINLLDPDRSHNVVVGGWTLTAFAATGINHDKAIVVDRERAIVSNINLELPSDPSAKNPRTGQTWYQMGIEVHGEAARSVVEEMKTAWLHVGAYEASRAPDAPLQKDPKSGKTALPELAAASLPSDIASACLPIVSLGREVSSKDESAANAGFLALFANARERVRVLTPNLNATSALNALADATTHADVSVVVSKGFTEKLENLPGQGGGNEEVVTRKLPALIRDRGGDPCKIHVRYYARAAAPHVAVVGEAEGASHAKLATADGTVVVIGSQNMDTQSWEVSRELSLAVDDRATTAKYDAELDAVWDRAECAFECGGCN